MDDIPAWLPGRGFFMSPIVNLMVTRAGIKNRP